MNYLIWLLSLATSAACYLIDTKPFQLICQVVPAEMADKLFEACGSDSYEKLDLAVKVKSSMILDLQCNDLCI